MALLEAGPVYENDRAVLRAEVFDGLEPTLEELQAIEAEEVGELEVDPLTMMTSYIKGLRGQKFATGDVSRFQPDYTAVERKNFMQKVIRALERDEEAAPRLRAEGNTKGRKYWLASLFSAEAAAEGPAWFEANANVELGEFAITNTTELHAVRRLLRELHSMREAGVRELNGLAIRDIFTACNNSIMTFRKKITDEHNAEQSRATHASRTKTILAIYDEQPAVQGFKAFANCRGVDPDLFFPSDGASVEIAKSVCRGCTVREACLEYALENNEQHGVWGGESERERRRLRKQRILAAKALQEVAEA